MSIPFFLTCVPPIPTVSSNSAAGFRRNQNFDFVYDEKNALMHKNKNPRLQTQTGILLFITAIQLF
jgi:hypothetical protein